ncbi:helix-turn-helix domain-containing protein [Actinokineospora xionganensis]|uniref:Winged helix-turn-helix domain-containing protein n=1 Tax=Actinokineospora xionganensis TaxID=2684470 RepID=A0ABR7L516_9PSEU|nr:helix-turn-helix domain-containing protein [Actinokineospora xionganensis]MBC6447529.1 winged helix-turn-helix domain-containing protein [Actinokineospora xionganensis]
MKLDVKNRVKFVRWPAESDLREECTALRHLCLLIVEHGAPPPEDLSPNEDWVRPPIVPQDLQARVRQLAARAVLNTKPVLDPAGILYFRDASVTLSLTQCDMLAPLISRFCGLVYRDELREILEQSGASSSSNALDLHVMRLRRRLQLVGLGVRNVWGRGFVVEPL